MRGFVVNSNYYIKKEEPNVNVNIWFLLDKVGSAIC